MPGWMLKSTKGDTGERETEQAAAYRSPRHGLPSTIHSENRPDGRQTDKGNHVFVVPRTPGCPPLLPQGWSRIRRLTFDVMLATTEPRPSRPAFTSCWVVSRGPTALVVKHRSMASAVTWDRPSQLATPALLITTYTGRAGKSQGHIQSELHRCTT